MADLKQEFQYYLDNKSALLNQYNNKYIVLKDNKVIGVYEDRLVAIEETKKQYPIGSFLVQYVSSADDEQVRFHSRHAI